MYNMVYNKMKSSTSDRGDCAICLIKPFYHVSKFLGICSVDMTCFHGLESDVRTIETSKTNERTSLVISTFLLLCTVKCIEELCKIEERNFTDMYKYIYLTVHTWGAASICLSFISNTKRLKMVYKNLVAIFEASVHFDISADSHERLVKSIKKSVWIYFSSFLIFMVISFDDCMKLAEGTEWYYFKVATAFIAYNSYAVYMAFVTILCIILRELINAYNQQVHIVIKSISQENNVIEGRNTAPTLQAMVELYNTIYKTAMAFIELCGVGFFIYISAIPALEFLSVVLLFVEEHEGKLDVVAIKTLTYIFIPDYIFTLYVDQLNNIVSIAHYVLERIVNLYHMRYDT